MERLIQPDAIISRKPLTSRQVAAVSIILGRREMHRGRERISTWRYLSVPGSFPRGHSSLLLSHKQGV